MLLLGIRSIKDWTMILLTLPVPEILDQGSIINLSRCLGLHVVAAVGETDVCKSAFLSLNMWVWGCNKLCLGYNCRPRSGVGSQR